jgi:hypothetical protein
MGILLEPNFALSFPQLINDIVSIIVKMQIVSSNLDNFRVKLGRT